MKKVNTKNLKKERGITLVALVVTIIILLILASVTISLVVGENGLITKAREAKTKAEQDAINTQIAMNTLYNELISDDYTGENGGSGNKTTIEDNVIYDNTNPELTVEVPTSTNQTKVTVSGTAKDDNDIKSVTVNGSEVTVQADGSWTAEVAVPSEDTTITVVATDTAGNTITVTKTVLFSYSITVNTVTGGTLVADQTVAINGKTITLTPTSATGYYYDGATVSYTDKSGIAQTTSLDADTLTFTMLAADVIITPKWKNIEGYIIASGHAIESVVGGWTQQNYNYSTGGPGVLSEHLDEGYLQIRSPEASYSWWTSGNAIETSKYDTLYLDYAVVFNVGTGATKEIFTLGSVSYDISGCAGTLTRGTVSFDISSLTTDCHLELEGRAWGYASGAAAYVYIYNMWMENSTSAESLSLTPAV